MHVGLDFLMMIMYGGKGFSYNDYACGKGFFFYCVYIVYVGDFLLMLL